VPRKEARPNSLDLNLNVTGALGWADWVGFGRGSELNATAYRAEIDFPLGQILPFLHRLERKPFKLLMVWFIYCVCVATNKHSVYRTLGWKGNPFESRRETGRRILRHAAGMGGVSGQRCPDSPRG